MILDPSTVADPYDFATLQHLAVSLRRHPDEVREARARALAAWEAAQPRCPSPSACRGRCGLSRAAAWAAALEEDEARRSARRREERTAEVLRAANVDPRALGALATLADTPALAAARHFLGGARTFLALLGGKGSGKTVAAAYVARERAVHGPLVWRHATELQSLGLWGAEALLADMRTCRTLVLDDLGTEYASDKAPFRAHLDGVLNHRYAHRLATVLTSNLDEAGVAERLGARIWDRIVHDGLVVRTGAESLRRPGAGAASR